MNSPPGRSAHNQYAETANERLFKIAQVSRLDLIWNALHTFVRVPIAALLAYGATSQLSPEKQLLASMVGGLIALAAHGGKTAVRGAVTPSPEPISNISLSLGEDALAIFLTWFGARHPYSAAAIVIVLLAIIILLIRWGNPGSESLVPGCRARVGINPFRGAT